MSKTPEEMAEEYANTVHDLLVNKDILTQVIVTAYKTGHTAGFESAMKIHDCVAEYVAKKEGIHTEVITHEPLLKDYK